MSKSSIKILIKDISYSKCIESIMGRAKYIDALEIYSMKILELNSDLTV